SGRKDNEMRTLFLTAAFAAAFAAASPSAEAAPRSASGPRGPSGGVEFAPIDARGPTLKPDNLLTPDSGWMGSGSAGVAGPIFSWSGPTLFGEPVAAAPPPPKRPQHKPHIILNQ